MREKAAWKKKKKTKKKFYLLKPTKLILLVFPVVLSLKLQMLLLCPTTSGTLSRQEAEFWDRNKQLILVGNGDY